MDNFIVLDMNDSDRGLNQYFLMTRRNAISLTSDEFQISEKLNRFQ